MRAERAVNDRIDGQRSCRVEMGRPVDLADAGVERPFVCGVERVNRLENANCCSQPDVGAIQQSLIAAEVDQPPPWNDLLRAKRLEFGREHALQPENGLRGELK